MRYSQLFLWPVRIEYACCLALCAFSSFFFPFKWEKWLQRLQRFRFLADRTEVGWSRRSSKGDEKKPLWNFKKRDGESLDYKRGAALDQVISDSSDVGGKAAGLQL